MPSGGNFTLRTLADNLTAEKCTHRFVSFQRSGQYSELRIVHKGRSKNIFRIVGYKWPARSTRRKLGIGKKNPSRAKATPNQVWFGQYGKTKMGWISRETPTRYEITFKEGHTTRTVVRHKRNVQFVASDKRGKVQNHGHPTMAENPRKAIKRAVKRSADFHQLLPRRVSSLDLQWPKALVVLGACSQVNYVSDKFDEKVREYFHEFKKGAVLLTGERPQRNGKDILIIIGKFKIRPEGITG